MKKLSEERRCIMMRWFYFAIVAAATTILSLPIYRNVGPIVFIPVFVALICVIFWASARFGRSFDNPDAQRQPLKPGTIFRMPSVGSIVEVVTWMAAIFLLSVLQGWLRH